MVLRLCGRFHLAAFAYITHNSVNVIPVDIKCNDTFLCRTHWVFKLELYDNAFYISSGYVQPCNYNPSLYDIPVQMKVSHLDRNVLAMYVTHTNVCIRCADM